MIPRDVRRKGVPLKDGERYEVGDTCVHEGRTLTCTAVEPERTTWSGPGHHQAGGFNPTRHDDWDPECGVDL